MVEDHRVRRRGAQRRGWRAAEQRADGRSVECRDRLVEHRRGDARGVGDDHLQLVLAVGQTGRVDREVDRFVERAGVEVQVLGHAIRIGPDACAVPAVAVRGAAVGLRAIDQHRDRVDARAGGGLAGGELQACRAVRVGLEQAASERAGLRRGLRGQLDVRLGDRDERVDAVRAGAGRAAARVDALGGGEDLRAAGVGDRDLGVEHGEPAVAGLAELAVGQDVGGVVEVLGCRDVRLALRCGQRDGQAAAGDRRARGCGEDPHRARPVRLGGLACVGSDEPGLRRAGVRRVAVGAGAVGLRGPAVDRRRPAGRERASFDGPRRGERHGRRDTCDPERQDRADDDAN